MAATGDPCIGVWWAEPSQAQEGSAMGGKVTCDACGAAGEAPDWRVQCGAFTTTRTPAGWLALGRTTYCARHDVTVTYHLGQVVAVELRTVALAEG